jgi:hypothetical protein
MAQGWGFGVGLTTPPHKKQIVTRSEKATVRRTYLRPEGDRGIGRPKLRWGDSVNQDIRLLGERNWRTLAKNREEWNKLLKKARTHTGLSSQ